MHAFLIMGNFFILEKIPKIFLNEIQIMFTIETYCRALFHRQIFFLRSLQYDKRQFSHPFMDREHFFFSTSGRITPKFYRFRPSVTGFSSSFEKLANWLSYIAWVYILIKKWVPPLLVYQNSQKTIRCTLTLNFSYFNL